MKCLLIIALLLWPVAGWADEKLPDYCGNGPVEISLSRHLPCPCDCSEQITGSRVFGYTLGGPCLCTTQLCSEYAGTQRWTDYPECGAEKITE